MVKSNNIPEFFGTVHEQNQTNLHTRLGAKPVQEKY